MKTVRGFVQFVREQGVVGLAIGFILGGAISKLTSSLVTDVIQPAVGLLFGSRLGLDHLAYKSILYGKFIAGLIDFLILAAVVYWGFKGLGLDRIDKQKEMLKKD